MMSLAQPISRDEHTNLEQVQSLGELLGPCGPGKSPDQSSQTSKI